jgi:aminoglycoside phosphotransferase (APT) family kinase protein
MKSQHPLSDVAAFLEKTQDAVPASVKLLVEGNVSQAFSFETKNGTFVCRLANSNGDFLADRYASDTYGRILPIPPVTATGKYDADTYFCVTNFVEGRTALSLDSNKMAGALPAIRSALGKIYSMDVSQSSGYGLVDASTGNAKFESWQAWLQSILTHDRNDLKLSAKEIELNETIIDRFFAQLESNARFGSETRRLFHGDPGFDNILMKDGQVSAIIDWGQMGYGDWMSDFARLEFWSPGTYGDTLVFAEEYGLESDNINERKALYWAINALWAIEFAHKNQNENVIYWLRSNATSRLL